jgi:3-phenylpropionate/trans-cinnamate dioxygenase ferredoxin component
MSGIRVCALSELDDRKATAVEVDGEPVVLVRDGDTVHALRDECSHASVPLSDGEVAVDRGGRLTVECWLHGSCFELTTGEPTSPPASQPVDVLPTTVRDGDVFVTVAGGN